MPSKCRRINHATSFIGSTFERMTSPAPRSHAPAELAAWHSTQKHRQNRLKRWSIKTSGVQLNGTTLRQLFDNALISNGFSTSRAPEFAYDFKSISRSTLCRLTMALPMYVHGHGRAGLTQRRCTFPPLITTRWATSVAYPCMSAAYSGDRDHSFRLNVTVAHEMVLRD